MRALRARHGRFFARAAAPQAVSELHQRLRGHHIRGSAPLPAVIRTLAAGDAPKSCRYRQAARLGHRASLPGSLTVPRLYNRKGWEVLRCRVFLRDGYICQMCGRLCRGVGQEPTAPVADHIRPHRGDERLFWDLGNLQTLCKSCHDGPKQALENGGRIIGPDGWPVDLEAGDE